MDWVGIGSLFLANFSIVLWFRAEARADWRHMDAEMKEFREIMYNETKEFHEKLCKLEEKYLKQRG